MTEQEKKTIEESIDEATVAVESNLLNELDSAEGGEPIGLDSLLEVPVRVTVQIGKARMTLARLIDMRPGSLVPLDREAHEPADILVNGRIVARGEVVTIDHSYGVRITSVLKDD
ncbi:MAG: flagellar motor switch protein FliN/FliY [Chlamydiales bacterium]|jgi:flagellar motor switch protein FliN/FliY